MTNFKSMGGHQGSQMKSDEWLTPPWIIERLGPFDLDPCTPLKRPWNTAREHYSKEINGDGLILPWHGRVWCNPPYGRFTGHWLEKCSAHRDAIALVFARTETSMFFKWVWPCADALLFMKGRISFYNIDGTIANKNSGAPSVLIAYGEYNAERLCDSGIPGKTIILK